MMPRMDGVTMTLKLREHHDFPVIMLSAKSEETDKVIGLNIGSLTVVGSGLEIRQMHRERLTIIGQIDSLTYGEGGLRGCGG